ncbi:MAG: VanZ family protein [Hespellia sp.]|nr:VanZ family protein [Hespellia sp.]
MNKRKIIFMILTVCWMIGIFTFSSRTAELSSQDSNHVGIVIGEMFVPDFENWSKAKQQAFAEKVDHPIRKTAHAAEYAVLGAMLMGVFAGEQSKRWSVLKSWILGTGYAATDEFHQLFVAGRSGQMSDVMLDSFGVFAGVLIACFFLVLQSKYRKGENSC